MIVSELILRDFLRRECPESYDKTSKACLKRLNSAKLRKEEPKHDFLVEQLMEDADFKSQFGERALRIGKQIRIAAGLDTDGEVPNDISSDTGSKKQWNEFVPKQCMPQNKRKQLHENWTSDPEFLALFSDIYECVKLLQDRPVSDLPSNYNDIIKQYRYCTE